MLGDNREVVIRLLMHVLDLLDAAEEDMAAIHVNQAIETLGGPLLQAEAS